MMSLIAVSNNFIVVCKGSYVDYYDYSTHTIFQLTSEKSEENESILDVVISNDEKFLAVLVSKKLLLYELPHKKNIKNFILPRSASKIRFGVNNAQIFVADKTGDVLQFKLNESSGSKLLGHLSLLLNVLQTNDGKYIITSDRDEKIRVSCYPNTYSIQTYCLGHKEFVNHLELLPHDSSYLTSASGDGTIKFWDYISGKLLYTIDTYVNLKNNAELKQNFCEVMDEEGIEINSLPITAYTVTKFNEFSSLLAVTVHSHINVLIYQLSIVNEQFSHNFVKDVPVFNFPAAIKFHNLSLFVYDDIKSEINEYQIVNNNDSVLVNFYKSLKAFENMTVELNAHNNLIKLLFKRKFDNVQEYQERKRQRLEKPISV